MLKLEKYFWLFLFFFVIKKQTRKTNVFFFCTMIEYAEMIFLERLGCNAHKISFA
jgi:hypothetical protein